MSPEDRALGLKVLATPMRFNDADADSIQGYLVALLVEVWREQDNFSGKRPFGNSGWNSELQRALVEEGLVDGELHSDGWLSWVDRDHAHHLIELAIQALLPEEE